MKPMLALSVALLVGLAGCQERDAAKACAGGCTEGQVRCEGGGLVRCVATSGCPAWSAPRSCDAGQTCAEGRCVTRCADTCQLGAARCAPMGAGPVTCEASADGCPDWSAPVGCPSGSVCREGACEACDPAVCQLGAQRCAAGERQTCGELVLSPGCRGWLAPQACPGGQRCATDDCRFDPSAPHTDRIAAIPDYLQTDPAFGGLPGGGVNHCAPVAVSNGLIWLDDHGYDELVADSGDAKRDQFLLIDELGGEGLMNTNTANGTSPSWMLSGLHKLILARGYQYQALLYQGFRMVGGAFVTGVETPELEWIKRGLAEPGTAVWINVGWYDHDPADETYTRTGGHWLTVVGYGSDGSRDDPSYLILHDPGPWAGASFAHEHVELVPIGGGTLVGDHTGLPRAAKGYYLIEGGMHRAPGMERAVLDGAVVLKM